MDAATLTIDAGTDMTLGGSLGAVSLVSTGQTQLSAGGRILSSVAVSQHRSLADRESVTRP